MDKVHLHLSRVRFFGVENPEECRSVDLGHNAGKCRTRMHFPITTIAVMLVITVTITGVTGVIVIAVLVSHPAIAVAIAIVT